MSEEKEVKNIEFELKENDESKGQVKAVFSVFNSLDSDGDVVLPNAVKSGFKSGDVPMVWSHKWDMPIGKGKIVKDDDKATFNGNFFMDTESGKEAYNLVKSMGDLQQWSFGFRVNDSEYGKFKKDANDDEQEVRYLKDLSVYEVSPVLVGANQETFTMAIKSDKETEEKIVQSISISDDSDDRGIKDVLTSDSIKPEDPKEEEVKEEKAAAKDDMFDTPAEAEIRAKELGCAGSHMHEVDGKTYHMPCATHEDYESQMKKSNTAVQYLQTIAESMKEVLKSIPTDDASIEALKEITEKISNFVKGDSEVSEKSASVQGKRFSDEVKDVLAALNNLVARVQSIGELRKKNGRKLGASATEALRAVQESVSDAFEELDKFVDEFGTEGALEIDVVEEVETQPEVEVEAEVEAPAEAEVETEETLAEVPVEETQEEPKATEESVSEEAEEGATAEALVEAEITEVEVDSELDDLWLESQQIVTDSILTDIEIEENENI